METTGTFTINLPTPSSENTYFVSLTGNDNNQGTKESPFRTHAHAFNLAKEGDKVISEKGQYVEISPIRLKTKQTWEGQGVWIITDENFQYSHDLEKYAVIIAGVNDVYVNSINIHNARHASGILIQNSEDILLNDVATQEGSFTGIWVLRSQNVKIEGFSIKNSAWGNDDWQSGNLLLTESTNLKFIGFTIEDFGEDVWGYGVKTFQWGGEQNFLKNCKFITGNFRGNGVGRFSPQNEVPNFAIELFEAQLERVEILNCNLEQMLSLSSSINQSEELAVNVENTTIVPRFGEAVELSASNVQFKNCKLLSARMASFANYKSYLIENVIVQDCTIISGTTPYKNAFLYTEGDMDNLRFLGNSFISVNASPISMIKVEKGTVSNLQFITNKFERKEEEHEVLDDHFAMINTENNANIQDVRYLANTTPEGFNKIYRGNPEDLDSLTVQNI